jgi:hypothetical protein
VIYEARPGSTQHPIPLLFVIPLFHFVLSLGPFVSSKPPSFFTPASLVPVFLFNSASTASTNNNNNIHQPGVSISISLRFLPL